MLKFLIFSACCFFSLLQFGEAILCYHCYERSNSTVIASERLFGEKFVPCNKNPNLWNVYDCPSHWPECVIITGRVNGQYELARSCAQKDFCSKYVPPIGVKVETCRDCKSDLCNDYLKSPEPPVGPGPMFSFNININLNVRKFPLKSNNEWN